MTTKEFRDRWTAALRSGDHQQGRGHLRPTLGTFCCLGVACDLYDPLRWNYERGTDSWNYTQHESELPHDVREAYGLTAVQEDELIQLNDGGYSFAEIADKIQTWMMEDLP